MKIFVVKGGFSREREISLRTGLTFENSIKNLGYECISFDLKENNIVEMIGLIQQIKPDLIMNALHGTFGEDGTLQGIFEALKIPFSHSGVLASSLAMNKVYSKLIFERFGLSVPAWYEVSIDMLKKGDIPLPMPFIIKPISEGSTIGTTLIQSLEDLKQALQNWNFGDHALIEEFIQGREFTISILDNEVLGIAEIKTNHTLFDYEAKYTTGEADRIIPAPLNKELEKEVIHLAKMAHTVLGCKGLTRTDIMYDGEKFYLLEINTQPGFTQTSFAVLKAEQRGWSVDDLVLKLIQSALHHHGVHLMHHATCCACG